MSRNKQDSLPKVSVVITNYRNLPYIQTCLHSVLKTDYHDYEVIVVDQSTPDLEEWMRNNFPGVRLFQAKDEPGAAKCRNIGVELASADYVAFLDNDTVVHQDWLRWLVVAVASATDVAATQSKLLRLDRPDVIDGLGDSLDLYGSAISEAQGKHDEDSMKENREIFSARSAAMLVRKSAYIQVHGMDEDFDVTNDDVDLGWRLRLAGYRIVLAPASKVYHRSGGTRFRDIRKFWFHTTKNRISALVKNYEYSNLLRYCPISIVLLVLLALSHVLARRLDPFMGSMHGFLWLVVNFRSVWSKRLVVQYQIRKVPDSELKKLMRPVKIGQMIVERIRKGIR